MHYNAEKCHEQEDRAGVYQRKTIFAASRRQIFSPTNPSRWEAISASGQTEQTEAKEEYWLLLETTSTPVL